jgi:two-component system phosphate regulon sensor histidine kinase PhoR
VNKRKFKAVIYLIAFTVILTVGIQVYRAFQNYNLNKQRFENDVQVAVDIAIEGYFSDETKEQLILLTNDAFGSKENNGRSIVTKRLNPNDSSLGKNFAYTKKSGVFIDTVINSNFSHKGLSILLNDSSHKLKPSNIKTIELFSDSSNGFTNENLKALTAKIAFSVTQDSIQFDKLTQYIMKELGRKNISVDFALVQSMNGILLDQSKTFDASELPLSFKSKSTYLPRNQQLEMFFSNASLVILKRGLADLLISLLITISVVGSLFYLYRVINEQKEIAEIKNDLISNITHEFKTPIATVNSALEGIANFNQQNDKEKTAKYIDISIGQLNKLNLMVEKLLETATLESEALEIRKEPINLSQMLHTLIDKFRVVAGEKTIEFKEQAKDLIIEADSFHLENALSNLIDNAIKYGGDKIEISLAKSNGKAQVIVMDNGGFIEKCQKERVFDKFYRIPTGNQHDVKGFGIGLYYTKKIIEKHGGSIQLVLKPQSTSFEVAIA